jgi:hypothetical protein
MNMNNNLAVMWNTQSHSFKIPSWQESETLTQVLISGPDLGTRAKLLSFNRFQSRVVTGLLTGNNTLRKHLYLLGLVDSPLYRRCGTEEETSAHILCGCEALASIRHAHLGSFFLEPENIKSINMGAIWSFSKATGPLDLIWGTKGLLIRA